MVGTKQDGEGREYLLRETISVGEVTKSQSSSIASVEPSLATDELRKELHKDLKKRGEPFTDADTKADALLRADSTVVSREFNKELALVMAWKSAGEVVEDAPKTPYLDRLQAIAVELHITPRSLFNAVVSFSERNEHAHTEPPEPGDFLKTGPGGELVVDWSEFRDACNREKTKMAAELTAGDITQEQYDNFCEMADNYAELWIPKDTWSPRMIDRARNMHRQRTGEHRKRTKPTPPVLWTSFYSPGKWDNLL